MKCPVCGAEMVLIPVCGLEGYVHVYVCRACLSAGRVVRVELIGFVERG
jgi:predicted amidophosphoribosyltransferase